MTHDADDAGGLDGISQYACDLGTGKTSRRRPKSHLDVARAAGSTDANALKLKPVGAGEIGEGAAHCIDCASVGLVQKRTVLDADDALAVRAMHADERLMAISLKDKLHLIAIPPRLTRDYDVSYKLGSLFRREAAYALQGGDNPVALLAKL